MTGGNGASCKGGGGGAGYYGGGGGSGDCGSCPGSGGGGGSSFVNLSFVYDNTWSTFAGISRQPANVTDIDYNIITKPGYGGQVNSPGNPGYVIIYFGKNRYILVTGQPFIIPNQ